MAFRRNISTVIIAISFILMASTAVAQPGVIDSIKATINNITGTKRADTLNALAEHFINKRQYAVAKTLSLLAMEEARKINYPAGEGAAYTSLGVTEYMTRDFLSAEKNNRHAIDIFKQLNITTSLANAYTLWARAVWAQSRFNEAVDTFLYANKLFKQMHDSANTGLTYGTLALVEEERGNYEKSFQYATIGLAYKNEWAFIALGQLYADVGDFESALDYYAMIKDSDLIVVNYLKVGEAYFQKQRYDSALYFYRRFIDIWGDTDKKALSKPYVLLGELYSAENKYDTALFYLQNALAGFKAVHDMNWVMRTLLELGRVYNALNQPQPALGYTRELLQDATKSGARQYARDGHYLLYQLYEYQHKSDSAYAHLKMYTLLSNAIGIDMSARKLALFKNISEREQAQLKIDLLNKQKQLQQEEIRRTSRDKGFLLVGVMVITLLFVVLIRNILLKKRNVEHLQQITENELHIQKLQSKKMLGELEMQVLLAQMNPHFIFNSLNSINRFILQNNKADATAYLTKFSRLVRMILQNSQNAMVTIEQELDSLKLYLELESLRFDGRFVYKITVDSAIDVSMLKVPPLVIQPFVENAIWHGLMPKETTGTVEIGMSICGDFIMATITDDGIGRIKAAALQRTQSAGHRSVGLHITSRRIKMLYTPPDDDNPVGIVDLVDAEGLPAGTQVTIKLPLVYD